jgi:hypothetical protein
LEFFLDKLIFIGDFIKCSHSIYSDSHESTVDTGSITTTTTASGKDEQLDERHKMHYHRTDANGNGTANGTKEAFNPQNVPVQMVHLSTLATGTTTSSTTPKSHPETSSRPISSSGRPVFTTTIHTTLRPIEGEDLEENNFDFVLSQYIFL